eukprot:GHVL01040079.1.p1 GENE.GHVL01040079.1~~GHVL01040079.1.p1  ORF type:complete len:488 (-),score=194.71 GHVL01040079.1:154-1617(-)
MWGALEDNDYIYIFFDCEGCCDLEKDNQHDTKLFTLILMLSNIFIYNSKGVIDELSIQGLNMIVNISEMLFSENEKKNNEKKNNEKKNNELYMPQEKMKISPMFIWILRDFCLELVDLEGHSITSDEYMEMALNSRNIDSQGKLFELFRKRHCVTLVQPVIEEEELNNLNFLDFHQLRPEFIHDIDKLKNIIFNNKNICFKGSMIIDMIIYYINILNNNRFPDINTSMLCVIENNCKKILYLCKDEYIYYINNIILPINIQELLILLYDIKEKLMKKLKNDMIGDEDHPLVGSTLTDFDIFCETEKRRIMAANDSQCRAQNSKIFDDLYKNIYIKLCKMEDNDEEYEGEFDVDYDELERIFHEKSSSTDEDKKIFLKERREKENGKNMILLRKNRKNEENEILKQKNLAEENERKRLELEKEEIDKNNNKNRQNLSSVEDHQAIIRQLREELDILKTQKDETAETAKDEIDTPPITKKKCGVNCNIM